MTFWLFLMVILIPRSTEPHKTEGDTQLGFLPSIERSKNMSNDQTVATKPKTVREPLMNIQEAAEYLGCTPAAIYKWRQLGKPSPKAVLVGSLLRFKPADLDLFIESRIEDVEVY